MGIIPQDWNICEIGALNPYVTSGSRGWAEYYADHGDAFIRITNLFRSSIYLDVSDLKFVRLPPESREGVRTALQDGDLLISITADIGIVGFVDATIPKPAYINQHIALARFDATKANSQFVTYFLASSVSQKRFQALTDQGAKAGMNLSTVKQIQTVLPPLPEQQAIAAALSDVDALIAAQEALVAKKRAIKQGAMQDLLTGRKRLPGFEGEWEEKRLGDILRVRHGKSQHSVNHPEGAYPIFASGGEIGRATEFLYDRPSVLIGRKGTIDEPRYADRPFWTVDTLFYTEISAGYSALFVYFRFCMIKWSNYNEASGVPSLNSKVIESIGIQIPSLPEQQAIAAILSDIDAEIEVLEAKVRKTQALKQGMMQELLTGRIRLV